MIYSQSLQILFLLFISFSLSAEEIEEQGWEIQKVNKEKEIVSVETEKNIFSKDVVYEIYSFGWPVAKAKFIKFKKGIAEFKVDSDISFIFVGSSWLVNYPIPIEDALLNTLEIQFYHFLELHKRIFRIEPDLVYFILFVFSFFLSVYRFFQVPKWDRKWRTKIIETVQKQNSDSGSFVAQELKEIPKRRQTDLAVDFVLSLPARSLLEVPGIGRKTIDNIEQCGFADLSQFRKFRHSVPGIGIEIQNRINSFIQDKVNESFYKLQSGALVHSNQTIEDYYENYKLQLNNQTSKLNLDKKEIQTLHVALQESIKKDQSLPLKKRLKAFFAFESQKSGGLLNNIRIAIGFFANLAVVFVLPLSLWVIPGIGFYSIILIAFFFVHLIAVYILFRHFIVSEYTIDAFGRQPLMTSLKEQRLQLEALRMSLKMGIRTPVVKIIDDPSYNAFAGGGRYVKSCIGVHSGLINGLKDDEVVAVLGHEIGHLSRGDSRFFFSLSTFSHVTFGYQNFGFQVMHFVQGIPFINIIALLFAYANYYLTNFIGSFSRIVEMLISQQQEFRADAIGAYLTNKESMVNALLALEETPKTDEFFVFARNSYLNDLSLTLGDGRSFIEGIFSTHPSIEDRINALHKYENPT